MYLMEAKTHTLQKEHKQTAKNTKKQYKMKSKKQGPTFFGGSKTPNSIFNLLIFDWKVDKKTKSNLLIFGLLVYWAFC